MPTSLMSGRPANAQEVAILPTISVTGLTDRTEVTVTFDDNADIAPSFADPTGDTQAWMQNEAITPVTVPAADGETDPDLRGCRLSACRASRSTPRRASYPVRRRLQASGQSPYGPATLRATTTGRSITRQVLRRQPLPALRLRR